MENNSRGFLQKLLLSLAMLLAAALVVVSVIRYRDASANLSALKSDIETSTASWKKINEEKLIIQRDLKAARNDLREVDLTIEESEEKAQEIRADITELEKEIEALKSGNP